MDEERKRDFIQKFDKNGKGKGGLSWVTSFERKRSAVQSREESEVKGWMTGQLYVYRARGCMVKWFLQSHLVQGALVYAGTRSYP